jgi:hypothetical protein
MAFAIACCALASRYLPITNHGRVIDGGPLAIPHALRGGFRDFVGLARHWILAIVAFGLTATTLAVQAPL